MLSDLSAIRALHPLPVVAARYLTLHSAGSGIWKALCPFHDEKTPSFYVYEDGGFKCHACGAHGDVFDLVRHMERVELPQAVRLLEGGSWTPSPCAPMAHATAKRKRRDWLTELQGSRVSPLCDDTPGARYLQGRGIPSYLARAVGVLNARDWFGRASVLFPIVGQDGQTLAVQGRAINSTHKITVGPKTFGVFATPGALCDGQLADEVALCEAPIDALSLFLLFDIPALGTCGGGLTKWIPSAARGTVWIATDADDAGDAYFEEWAPLLLHATVKRLRPPTQKDWNDELRLKETP